MKKEAIEPGIYFGMPEDEYHGADGLSCSGMKQLAVSPLNYWHNNLNPDRLPPEETYPQRFGKAVHCWLLERDSFWEKYAVALSQDDFEGLLVTIDDLKAYCVEKGIDSKAKRKQELIDRITATGEHPPIWDVELACFEETAAGKALLKKAEVAHITKVGQLIEADQTMSAILSGGMPEVSFFVEDPETGVMLKARMDYVKPLVTIDVKTFSNSRGKPTDKVVFDAIFYEKYNLQCAFYAKVRELARQQLAAGEIATHGAVSEKWLKAFTENAKHGFGFVFIESDEPFDMRAVQLRQAETPGADSNIYWLSATMQIDELTQKYVECRNKFGDAPWREPVTPHILADTDIPQLAFAA